ncbi:hypothetical protein OEA41_004248 [Lepraria neglecta]|uniref:Uncharacterized protein n=1 Tax=Lepraria neglecta TaxID=209136 RepID=A0AAE0DEB4_9LECA|nr:hypothetical protein OEA41_004248 [Lepraria neglecta]
MDSYLELRIHLFSLSDFRMLMLIVSGDNLTIQPSALPILRHPSSAKRSKKSSRTAGWPTTSIQANTSMVQTRQVSTTPRMPSDAKARTSRLMQSRIKFYKSLIRQAERLGLCTEYNKCVVSYYEDKDVGIGGVVLESGARREADAVIAADGIKTHSGKVISGEEIQPKESGMVIYRSAYPTEHALSEPLVKG